MTIHHKPTKCPVCKQEQEIVRLTATPTVLNFFRKVN
jgi:hypothetical protein